MTTEMKCRCSVKSTLKYSTTLSTHIHPAPLVAGHIPRTSTLHHPTSTLRPPLRGTSRAHPPCIPPQAACARFGGRGSCGCSPPARCADAANHPPMRNGFCAFCYRRSLPRGSSAGAFRLVRSL